MIGLIFATVFSGTFCPGKVCAVGELKVGTSVYVIGKDVCKGIVKSNFKGKDEEGVIHPFKGSVIEGCTGAYSIAVVSGLEPKMTKVKLKNRPNGDGSNYLSRGNCAITDRPIYGSYSTFRIGERVFFQGQMTCIGGCGDAPQVVFDITKCKLEMKDCTFCT